MEQRVFVTAGVPNAVMGSATRDVFREGGALAIPPSESWGNALFADAALEEGDFRIHASLTLDRVGGTGTSLLLGGHYHYPCSRPEGNDTFRVALDDDMEVYDGTRLDTEARIVYGKTLRRGPWTDAEKVVAGKTADHIRPGEPFELDWEQNGDVGSFSINGKELFRADPKQVIKGMADGGWPASFGFLADRGVIRLHEFRAEGIFSGTQMEHTDVWTQGHGGYWAYRIPSLCVTPKGTLLAFAEARRFDFTRWDWRATPKPDEVHTVMKRSEDGGKTWSEQQVLLGRGHAYESRDPSPVIDWETGAVFLLTRGPYIMQTEDDGESWSEPRELDVRLEGVACSPGPCRGIQVTRGTCKGRLVVPVYGKIGDGRLARVIYSDDHGRNWQRGGQAAPGTAEPQLIELEDGSLLLNCRTPGKERGRYVAVSRDGGDTFEDHRTDEDLPCSGCQATLARYRRLGNTAPVAGSPVLFSGPAEGRRKMTVKVSHDDCQTWSGSHRVYEGHSAYSAMVVLPDGGVGLLYERDGYRRTSFARLEAEQL